MRCCTSFALFSFESATARLLISRLGSFPLLRLYLRSMAAQSGSITQKIKEQALIQMLESISGAAEAKVTIQRRDDDDSSDDDNDDWAR